MVHNLIRKKKEWLIRILLLKNMIAYDCEKLNACIIIMYNDDGHECNDIDYNVWLMNHRILIYLDRSVPTWDVLISSHSLK